jgi:hypothetical protein
VTDKLVNVRFYATTYGRGAAHAVDYFFVFNFDLTSSNELKLPGLFEPNAKFLSALSEYSKVTVTQRICRHSGKVGTQAFADCLKNPYLWEEGINATLENYKAWSLTKDGLLISFDPCQLTGCAAGEIYVVVPYSKLKGLIRPKTVLGSVTQDL